MAFVRVLLLTFFGIVAVSSRPKTEYDIETILQTIPEEGKWFCLRFT